MLTPSLPATNRPGDGVAGGMHLGDYEILHEIARGGMGIVYKARQISLQRLVALKQIAIDAPQSPAAMQRFLAEAASVASLDHPHIVPIYEYGEHQGQPYFSMKLLDGGNLEHYLRASPGNCPFVPQVQRKAAHLVALVARAVHYAHQRGVLHRDLKPANILLDGAGQPHVTDFGLAKRLAEGEPDPVLANSATSTSTELSRAGVIAGTPRYMAPEQAAGRKRLTTAADVYSLGALLYEMLTGGPVFQGGPDTDILRKVREETPRPPRAVNPGLDPDLECITLKCLKKDPAERYSSAEALAQDLEAWLRGETITARPVGRIERLRKWTRRRPAIAGLTFAVAVLSVLGVGLVSWKWIEAARAQSIAEIALRDAQTQKSEAERERDRANAQEKQTQAALRDVATQRDRADLREKQARAALTEAEAEREKARKELERSEIALYASQIADAQKNLDIGRWDLAKPVLSGTRWDLRGWEHQHLWSRCLARMKLLEHVQFVQALVFTPDNKRLAVALGGTGAYTVQPDPPGGLVFDPDALNKDVVPGEIVVWDVATAQVVSRLKDHTRGVYALAVSPDGKTLASGSVDTTVKLWDVERGELLRTLTGHEQTVRGLAFSPDGKRLASASTDKSVRLWDVASGEMRRSFTDFKYPLTCVAFSPDGQSLAAGELLPTGTEVRRTKDQLDARVRVWDIESGRPSFAEPAKRPVNIAFSAGGKLTFADLGPLENALCTCDLSTGKVVRERMSLGSYCQDVRGDFLAFASIADHEVKVRDLRTGKDAFTFRLSNSDGRFERGPTIMAFSSNGKLLATSERNTVELWAIAEEEHLSLPTKSNDVTSLIFATRHDRLVAGSAHFARKDTSKELIHIWDLHAGKESLSLPGYFAALDSQETCLAVAKRTSIALVDFPSGRPLRTLDASTLLPKFGRIETLAFSPDGTLLAASLGSPAPTAPAVFLEKTAPNRIDAGPKWNHIVLWNVSSGEVHKILKGHKSIAQSLAFHPGGKLLASSDAHSFLTTTSEVKVWDIDTATETLSFAEESPGGVGMVGFSPDGKILASMAGNKIRLRDPKTGTPLAPLLPGNRFCFHPAGKQIATLGQGEGSRRQLTLWDLRTGQKVFHLLLEDSSGHHANRLAFDATGHRIAVTNKKQSVDVYPSFDPSHTIHAGFKPYHAAFSPDGKQVFSAGGRYVGAATDLKREQYMIRETGLWRGIGMSAWDAASGRLQTRHFQLEGAGKNVWACAFAPAVNRIAYAAADEKDVCLAELDSGKVVHVLKGHSASARSLAFSLDGKILVVGASDGALKVWNVASGVEAHAWSGHAAEITKVAFHPAGKLLASASRDSVKILDLNAMASPRTISPSIGSIAGLAFHPHKPQLAICGREKVLVVDCATGKELLAWKGHSGWVNAVAYHPDGDWLATCGQDGAVIVWKSASARRLHTFEGHTKTVTSVAFHPDGMRLASTGWDGAVKLWQLPVR